MLVGCAGVVLMGFAVISERCLRVHNRGDMQAAGFLIGFIDVVYACFHNFMLLAFELHVQVVGQLLPHFSVSVYALSLCTQYTSTFCSATLHRNSPIYEGVTS